MVRESDFEFFIGGMIRRALSIDARTIIDILSMHQNERCYSICRCRPLGMDSESLFRMRTRSLFICHLVCVSVVEQLPGYSSGDYE